MAKVLIFSDLHLHNWSYGASYKDGWNDRLLDQKSIADQLINLADLHKCDVAVFCGDLFHVHGRVEAGPLKVAADLFSKLRQICRKVFVLVGNHDMGRETNSVSWLKNIGISVVEDAWADQDYGLGFIPYYSEREPLLKRIEYLKERKLPYWFMHQGVKNVAVGSDFVIPNEIFGFEDLPEDEVFEHCFTGHYHSHRGAVKSRLTVVGAPMQFNWSDIGEDRGAIVLDTWSNTRFFTTLNYPRFIILNSGLNIITSGGNGKERNVDNCFVRISGDIPTIFMEDLRKKLFEAGARSVEFTFKKPLPTTGFSKEEDFNIQSLIDRYIEANNISDEGKYIGSAIRNGMYEACQA